MKALILEKLDDLNNLRTKLRDEFVPLTVCTHLEQCIKETEVSTCKMLSFIVRDVRTSLLCEYTYIGSHFVDFIHICFKQVFFSYRSRHRHLSVRVSSCPDYIFG